MTEKKNEMSRRRVSFCEFIVISQQALAIICSYAEKFHERIIFQSSFSLVHLLSSLSENKKEREKNWQLYNKKNFIFQSQNPLRKQEYYENICMQFYRAEKILIETHRSSHSHQSK